MANPELVAKIAATTPNPSTTLDSAIQRYLHGESMQVLAKELSISRATIYNWMLRKTGPEQWADLRQQAMIQRIALADERLENAHDAVDIARAREQARFARMDYERLCKDYAPKQEVERHDHITVVLHPNCDEQPVIPHIVNPDSIISVNSEVIDNQEKDQS